MEDSIKKFSIKVLRNEDEASSISDSFFSYFNEEVNSILEEYYKNNLNKDLNEYFHDKVLELTNKYVGDNKETLDEYIKNHNDVYSKVVKSSLFDSFSDKDKYFKLALLNANYTIFIKNDDEGTVISLNSNLPVIKENVAVETKVEEPVKEEKVDEEMEVEDNPFTNIKKRSFEEKLKASSKELKDKYVEISTYATSLGLKGRVSKACDTYHLGRKTYLKINIVGKTIKCYFALDTMKYATTTIPFENVKDKKKYSDTPLLFRVKSDLSVRRCKKLLDDMMKKEESNEEK